MLNEEADAEEDEGYGKRMTMMTATAICPS
jgi:hypothetical protein